MRSSVALGPYEAQTFLPSASNMDKLDVTGTELQSGDNTIAQNLVQNCPQVEGQVPQQFGGNYRFFGQNSSVFDRRFPIQSAMLLWSKIPNVMWPTNDVFNSNAALRIFVNIILANTISVGCSGAMCMDTAAASRVFSSPSLVARGLARNGQYPNENAPPASRMVLTEYDCQAEQVAFNHVRSCDRIPAPPIAGPGHSENIHVLATAATDVLEAIQIAIVLFTNELAASGIPSNTILTPQVAQRTQRTVTRVSKGERSRTEYLHAR
uniref:Peroxidase n=1 Tax=Angiostrongylus cantonensis TaxID=6313 RepID=A0A0K0DBE2_ANGCA